ncbi:MAG TPA: OsmC family protein [Actinomycetota bacterium]|jgi:putative redox protein|nr:OsmC family protein [Actinomycetota bacterium]
MSEVRLSWTGDRLQFVGRTGYGDVVTVGGDTDGPGAKPSDLLPISLAACTAYDVVVILHRQRQDLRALEAVITSTQDDEPPWTFRAIDIEWVVTGTVDRHKAERAVEIAESKFCAVAATIRPVVALSHRVRIEPTPSRG